MEGKATEKGTDNNRKKVTGNTEYWFCFVSEYGVLFGVQGSVNGRYHQ
jgi:hypothetical protein